MLLGLTATRWKCMTQNEDYLLNAIKGSVKRIGAMCSYTIDIKA